MEQRNDQESVRRQRRDDLLRYGEALYPARTNRSVSVVNLLKDWAEEKTATVAGRIRAMRVQGGSAFIDLHDETGKIQLFLQTKNLAENFQRFIDYADLGDFIEATGTAFTTKRGEPSLNVTRVGWLAKALRPAPSSWHGLGDVELRYRFRELDLLVNEKEIGVFRTRGLMIKTLRAFLESEGFDEVETPILQTIPGGATARPFVTHHNALDIDLYLRVAPELFLKRLIVGGFGRVYEIARCFRNEGIDRDHNPEFTQVELYAAYQDYTWMMKFVERMLQRVITAVHPDRKFTYQGQHIVWKTPLPRESFRDLVKKHAGVDIDRDQGNITPPPGVDLPPHASRAQVLDALFKTFVRPQLVQPTFVIDYPIELSPLAKKKADDPRYTERFQILMGGTELGNAFSELNDPIDQRERFEAQEAMRRAGDEEAQRVDEIFLRSLEYGLPPTAGLGLGIDRLTAILTDQRSVKEVILFPTLRPES